MYPENYHLMPQVQPWPAPQAPMQQNYGFPIQPGDGYLPMTMPSWQPRYAQYAVQQGFSQLAPQGYSQLGPQGYNQLGPQGYNQLGPIQNTNYVQLGHGGLGHGGYNDRDSNVHIHVYNGDCKYEQNNYGGDTNVGRNRGYGCGLGN